MGLFGTAGVGVTLGYNRSRWNYSDQDYRGLLETAREEDQQINKAFTTGDDFVNDSSTGGQVVRRQFLFGELEMTGPQQSDAGLVKAMPMKDAESTLIEWALQGYTGGGDGFVSETGSDGNFGVDFYDDPLERMSETMGFLAGGRSISDVSKKVNNIMDPVKIARRGLLTQLYKQANTAGYFGDRTKSDTQFNGIVAQMRKWCDVHPEDAGIQFDCGGQPINRDLLQLACTDNLSRFGDGDLLMMSAQARSDTTTLLWPENRNGEGTGGTFGGQYGKFAGPGGDVELRLDKMLRAGQPLQVDGLAASGLPRTTSTLDVGSIVNASNPFTSVVAGAAGAGTFWTNFTKNTDTAAVTTAPAVPSGVNDTLGGNNDNRMAAGSYYYALSLVYKGFESAAYIYGAGEQAANVISGSPTATAVTYGQVVKLIFDLTQITALGSTYARKLIKYRVYRYGGPSAAAPTRLDQFKFLMECGIPTTGNTTSCWDNGYSIPGSDNAFLITRKKDGMDEWGWMNLLPLMQKQLPILAMGELFCILWFTMPLLRNRRRHVHLRNVGRAR